MCQSDCFEEIIQSDCLKKLSNQNASNDPIRLLKLSALANELLVLFHHLYVFQYVMYMSSEGYSETVHSYRHI